jgi:hypothetical protein
MWDLFIATRKASLLNEFLANINRLGLMSPGSNESSAMQRTRISGYLQRFEALYGDLPDAIYDDVLSDRYRHRRYTQSDTNPLSAFSTTTIPVALSTVLIALGWVIPCHPPKFCQSAVERCGSRRSFQLRRLSRLPSWVRISLHGRCFFDDTSCRT